MLKKYLLLISVCLCTACSTTEQTVETCYSSYTAVNNSIKLGYTTTVSLNEQGYIDLDKTQTIVGYLDEAAEKADTASALCQMDIAAAFEALDSVKALINKTSIEKEEDNE